MPFVFDCSYTRLPSRFYARVRPTPVARPALLDAAGAGGVVRIGPGKLPGFGGEVRISVEPASGMPNSALVSSLRLA